MMNQELNAEQLNSASREELILMLQAVRANLDQERKQNEELMKKLNALQESIAVLVQGKFGRKTEKASSIPGQYVFDFENMAIINEAELLVEAKGMDEPKPEQVLRNRPKHYQKKKDKLAGVPVEDIPAEEIPEDELKQMFPNGYDRLKDEEYEELVIIPATLKIRRYHVAVYKSRPDKDGNVEFARGPRKGRLFGSDSLASPSLVAAIINGKYGNANPLNRLSNALLQKDLNLAPQNLAGWCIKAADRYFLPLYDLMHREMLTESELIHADESFFKVTEDMKKRGPNTKSYMWLYHTDQRYGCHPIFLYEYCDTRSHENPERFLEDYQGILMTDGYQAYHKLANDHPDQFTVAGCWAHGKRRFSNLLKSVSPQRAKGTVAYEANTRIQAIYHIDNMYKGLPREERKKMRQANVKPLVEAFFEYLKKISPSVDKSSETGKAVQYCLNQEQYLKEFLNDGIIPLDNNDAERSIRTFCVNRANWHIINSKNGARASGILLSMTETAKANGLKVFEYLTYVLDQMKEYAHNHLQKPTEMHFEEQFLKELLPWSEDLPESCRATVTR